MAVTTNYSWNLPTVGGDADAWGTKLNNNWTALDTLLGGVNATEIAILDGATVTTAELNYVSGVTSGIQVQLDALSSGKMATADYPDLVAIEALSSTGIAVRSGSNTWAQRTITGTANQITVTNGTGASGNPTIAAVVASQAEAEAGTDTTKLMTPQRVAQAIAAQGGSSYASAELTISAGGTGSVSHGLGARPTHVKAYWVCKTAEHGYSVGDYVDATGVISTWTSGTPYAVGVTVAFNSTSIKYAYGSTQPIGLLSLSNGTSQFGTAGNWRLVLKAWM